MSKQPKNAAFFSALQAPALVNGTQTLTKTSIPAAPLQVSLQRRSEQLQLQDSNKFTGYEIISGLEDAKGDITHTLVSFHWSIDGQRY